MVVDELPEGEKEGEESSSSRKKRKKKKKKKKDSKKAEEKPKKISGRTVAQKPLPTLYAGTGMDPDYGARKNLMKKVCKKLKKSKETLSTDSSDTSESSEGNELEADLLYTGSFQDPTVGPAGARDVGCRIDQGDEEVRRDGSWTTMGDRPAEFAPNSLSILPTVRHGKERRRWPERSLPFAT